MGMKLATGLAPSSQERSGKRRGSFSRGAGAPMGRRAIATVSEASPAFCRRRARTPPPVTTFTRPARAGRHGPASLPTIDVLSFSTTDHALNPCRRGPPRAPADRRCGSPSGAARALPATDLLVQGGVRDHRVAPLRARRREPVRAGRLRDALEVARRRRWRRHLALIEEPRRRRRTGQHRAVQAQVELQGWREARARAARRDGAAPRDARPVRDHERLHGRRVALRPGQRHRPARHRQTSAPDRRAAPETARSAVGDCAGGRIRAADVCVVRGQAGRACLSRRGSKILGVCQLPSIQTKDATAKASAFGGADPQPPGPNVRFSHKYANENSLGGQYLIVHIDVGAALA